MKNNTMKIGLAQISPVWLNKLKTTEKIIRYIYLASDKSCDLVVFGEALLPGYPIWLTRTDGAKFNSEIQKEFYAKYIRESVEINNGDLKEICTAAQQNNISVYLGIVERASDRANHTLYCTLVFINSKGEISSVHRKLMPTYEERLVWGIGDGHGLITHSIKGFTAGGLNCWENWMPLVRSSLYAQGENFHVAVWPGSDSLTKEITKFIALESRSYVASTSVFLRKSDISKNIPHYDLLLQNCEDIITNGGSCLSAPDGKWIIEPQINTEDIFIAAIDIEYVLRERQNLDLSGHYSRPDITKLTLNRSRQSIIDIEVE